MKKFLLEQKWVGVGFAVIVSLIIAWVATSKTAEFVQTVSPYISEEARDFLPVTFENGTITEPKDTVIAKEYKTGDDADSGVIKVVLNTEVDELSSDDIKNSGIYFSRKYMYAVSPQKTEIRDLSDIPNMTVDQEMFDNGIKWLESRVNGYLFVIIFFMMLSWIGLAAVIYAALSQLLIGKVVSSVFARTLRITTLGYLVLLIIELITGFGVNILIKLVLLVLLNYYINKQFYPIEK